MKKIIIPKENSVDGKKHEFCVPSTLLEYSKYPLQKKLVIINDNLHISLDFTEEILDGSSGLTFRICKFLDGADKSCPRSPYIDTDIELSYNALKSRHYSSKIKNVDGVQKNTFESTSYTKKVYINTVYNNPFQKREDYSVVFVYDYGKGAIPTGAANELSGNPSSNFWPVDSFDDYSAAIVQLTEVKRVISYVLSVFEEKAPGLCEFLKKDKKFAKLAFEMEQKECDAQVIDDINSLFDNHDLSISEFDELVPPEIEDSRRRK